MKQVAAVGALVMMLGVAGTAFAGEVEVRMLNKGAEGAMVFEPPFVQIAPGDMVKFVAADKGHNAESIDAMAPEGAKSFAGKINEEPGIVFDKPGVYGVKCKPHYAMGMVVLILVGQPDNIEKAKAVSHPGKAKQTFAKLFDTLATRTAAK